MPCLADLATLGLWSWSVIFLMATIPLAMWSVLVFAHPDSHVLLMSAFFAVLIILDFMLTLVIGGRCHGFHLHDATVQKGMPEESKTGKPLRRRLTAATCNVPRFP